MMIRGRSLIAAFAACAILLITAVPAHPSYNSRAGHQYRIASQRLVNLKKSKSRRKYRSYWIDCAKTFELVEKEYPKSPSAPEACFDRAGVYRDLYRYSRWSKDLREAVKSYETCQSTYPGHWRAPSALYRVIDVTLAYLKDSARALETFQKMSRVYPKSKWTAKARSRLGPLAANGQETAIRSIPAPVLSAPGKKLPDVVVKNIRYWSGGDYTRVVIDQENEAKFQVLELKSPDRLVFDLLNARIDPSVDKDPLPVNDGILRQVRASQYEPDIVRVVLDLANIKSYIAFPLHDPERLVIDVTGQGTAGSEVHMASNDAGQQNAAAPDEQASQETGSGTQAASGPPSAANQSKSAGGKLSLSRQLGLKVRTIAIDAGHGGHDPGAIGRRGTKEKDITLDIAKRLARLVKDRLGCKVILTRDKDDFIPLEERPAIAKTRGADLFVSIHVNANRRRQARGIETYIQGLRASDQDAMATAARENATTSKTLSKLNNELTRILKGLRMESNDEDSIHLAHAVQKSLVDSMKPVQGHVVNLGVKRAFFYVLINTEMPSILAEVGFISNPREERLLRKKSYRQAIAEALCDGVKKYIEARSPRQMGV